MKYDVINLIKDVRICIEENASNEALERFEDMETLLLEDLIKSKIIDGVRRIEIVAPIWLVEGKNIEMDVTSYVNVSDSGEVTGKPLAVPIDTVQIYSSDNDEMTLQTKTLDSVDAVIIDRNGKTSLMSISTRSINWFDPSGQKGGWIFLPNDFIRLLAFEMSDWDLPVFDAIQSTDAKYKLQKSPFAGVRGNPSKPVVAISQRTEGKTLEFYSCKSSDAKIVTASYLPERKIENNTIEISHQCYRPSIYSISSLVAMSRGESEFSALLDSVAKSMLI